jgi:hypothetical protein
MSEGHASRDTTFAIAMGTPPRAREPRWTQVIQFFLEPHDAEKEQPVPDTTEDRWRPMRGVTQDFWPNALGVIRMAATGMATGMASTPEDPFYLEEVQVCHPPVWHRRACSLTHPHRCLCPTIAFIRGSLWYANGSTYFSPGVLGWGHW